MRKALRIAEAVAKAAAAFTAWSVLSSAIYLLAVQDQRGVHLFHHYKFPLFQWWYFATFAWGNAYSARWSLISGGIATLLIGAALGRMLYVRWAAARYRPLHGETHPATREEMIEGGLKIARGIRWE